MPRYRANIVPVHQWQQRRFAAPQMGFGDYANLPGKVAGRFTEGAEVERVPAARKENDGTICSEYYHNKNYQIRTDKPLKTCTALKNLW
jgi:hypothetical protein